MGKMSSNHAHTAKSVAQSRPLVVIHGWSDHGRSFKPLLRRLRKQMQREPLCLRIADYLSMDDDVCFEDLVSALYQAWQASGLPLTPRAVDVVVHSTGGLIIRHFLCRYFTPDTAPIMHLLMLAPANFGSPLAHKGRAFYGRVMQGLFSQKPLQVGAQLLRGLELASPYSWDLAERDCFAAAVWYGPGRVLCTILVGDTGFSGVAAVANEIGTDGTVRMSCANLNCARVKIDLAAPGAPTWSRQPAVGQVAFRVLAGENHHTVVAKDGGPNHPETLALMVTALSVTDETFARFGADQARATQALTGTPRLHHMVFSVCDQYGQAVPDYFVEWREASGCNTAWSTHFHSQVQHAVHPYAADPSYRSVYLNLDAFEHPDHQGWEALSLAVAATPTLGRHGHQVGFHADPWGGVRLDFSKADIQTWCQPHQTSLIRLTLKREQRAAIFQLRKPG